MDAAIVVASCAPFSELFGFFADGSSADDDAPRLAPTAGDDADATDAVTVSADAAFSSILTPLLLFPRVQSTPCCVDIASYYFSLVYLVQWRSRKTVD